MRCITYRPTECRTFFARSVGHSHGLPEKGETIYSDVSVAFISICSELIRTVQCPSEVPPNHGIFTSHKKTQNYISACWCSFQSTLALCPLYPYLLR